MYHENKRQLEEYKRDIIEGKDYTVSDMPRGGITSDNTYSKVEKLMSSAYILKTEQMINVIESVINSLDKNRYKAIELLYFKKTHTVTGVSLEVYVHTATVYRWIDDVVYLIAKELGYVK